MNASISLSSLLNSINTFFEKYHSTIFFTTISLLLAGAILALYLDIQSPVSDETSEPVISSSFDQKTIDEIKDLRQSSESTRNLSFPSPRSNPFVE